MRVVALMLAIAIGLMLVTPAAAQVATSTLTGVVLDPAGMPVAGALVEASSADRPFSRSATTTADGGFRLAALPPGVYAVRVGHASFATQEIKRLELHVRQVVALEVRLRLAGRSETVTVTAAEESLDGPGSPQGFVVGSSQIRNLPLAQRNFADLAALGPGPVARHLGGFIHDVHTEVQPSRGALAINPPVNGVRGTANTFLLDGLLNTDGNVNAIVVHPPIESVQEFRLQTSAAPAEFGYAGGGIVNMVTRAGGTQVRAGLFEYLRNDAFDARNYFNPDSDPQAAFRMNQFGGQAGGPLPGASGLFFFGAYEGLRRRQGRSSASRVPDEKLRAGDFSEAGSITDPRTGQPFPEARIPAERLDPIAQTLLREFEPLPNRPGEVNNFLDAAPDARAHDSGSGRVDWNPSSRHSLFSRYTINSERAEIGHDLLLQPSRERLRAQHIAAAHTWSGSNTVNDLRAGFNRLRLLLVPRHAFERDVVGELGIGGIDRDPANYGLPAFILGNFMMASDDATLPLTQRDQLWQVQNIWSAHRGRHTVQAGGELRRFQMNYQQRQNGRGRFIFSGAYTGDAFGDFLLGLPQITERTVGQPQAYLRRTSYGLFLQDEARVTARLTLTLGVRYEFTSPFTETRSNLFNLDYSTLPAAPRLVRLGTAPFENGMVETDRNNVAPRVGLAWRPLATNNLVFRAAYGVHYSPEISTETYDLVRNGIRVEQNRAPDDRPLLTLFNGFPEGGGLGLPGYFGLDRDARTPYVQHWTAGWQAGVRRMMFEAAYVGTKGTRLGRFRNFNTPQRVETGENLPPRPGDLQQLRAFPELGKIIQRQHISNSIYHSLQLRAEKRLSSTLQFQASFTWAKAIDDADSIIPGLFDSVGAQDERNLRLERGLSFFDVRKRLAFNFAWQLPLATTLAAGSPLAVVLRGWTLSGSAVLQDGTPLNPVYFAFAPANSDTFNRPNVVPGQKIALPRGERTPERFFNTGAFSEPAPFTFGNAGRNIIPGPGNNVFDFALQRRFGLGERGSLDARAEVFNAFNHPNFGIPGPYPDFGPFFGKIFSVGEPRRVQLGLRLNW